MVEHGVDAAGIRHLELGVQIDVAIGRVDRTVQAFAGVGVAAQRLDGDLVLFLQIRKLNAVVLERRSRVQRLAIELDGGDLIGNQVKECR